MVSILDKIKNHKLAEVQTAKKQRPEHSFMSSEIKETRPFVKALRSKKPAIIAEIKKASPSQGIIREQFNVSEIAKAYELNGAACLSVLTDIKFFQGHPDYLIEAKAKSSLPVLRKDFIIDPYQITESREMGADCILLIVAMLDEYQLIDFCQQAQELNMAVLVESHTEAELEQALRLPTPLMGINNRDLHHFKTDLNTTIRLRNMISEDQIVISESGIHTHQDIQKLQESGVHCFLIGEHFMRADDVGTALNKMLN